MHIIWHGHSFVEIETKKGSYLIDPFITGNTHCDVSCEEVGEKIILGIFLTHGHKDHVGDTCAIYEKTHCPIVAEYGLGRYFKQHHDIDCIVGSIGGKVSCVDATIQFFIAHHGGGIMDTTGGYTCVPCGLLVTIGGKTIYHAGDTGLTYDFKLLGDYHTVDVACLPIGDVYTMGVEDAVIATQFINPTIVFPIHYNTRDKIAQDPVSFAGRVMQTTKTIPKVLAIGQYIVLGDDEQD